MTGDVQKYDKQVYLRATEAQRCKVRSVLVVPVFERNSSGRPLAVFEMVQVCVRLIVCCCVLTHSQAHICSCSHLVTHTNGHPLTI